MKHLSGKDLWALSLFPLIILFFCFALSQSDQVSSESHSDHKQEKTSGYSLKIEKERSFDETLASDPVAYYTRGLYAATCALAVFTILLAGVTILIWFDGKEISARQKIVSKRSLLHAAKSARAAEAAVAAANSSSERQLRAYVGVESVGFTNPAKTDVIFYVKNFGNTPGHECRVLLMATYVKPFTLDLGPIAPDQFIENALQGRSIVYPGNNCVTEIAVANGPIEASLLAQGTAAIRVWGVIRYTDAFGQAQHTGINIYSSGSRAFTSNPFINAPTGNEAT